FREDLFYRLHVLPIQMPPLRARRDDIVPLATRFLTEFAAEEGRGFTGFAPTAEAALRAYAWPGNVRELQNVVRRAVVLHDGSELSEAMLPIDPHRPVSVNDGPIGPMFAAESPTDADVAPYRHQERDIIETALAAFDGNILRAATALEISPSTIYRKRQAWAAEGLI
ncbi:MAG: sigma-54-dependent Fis family transcriptional regulator, partial [Hyphomicrobiales bacterium]|nr:sigma-54-dependent Fis family transcriptional regulator [Hyphomicrobiales bacterium]